MTMTMTLWFYKMIVSLLGLQRMEEPICQYSRPGIYHYFMHRIDPDLSFATTVVARGWWAEGLAEDNLTEELAHRAHSGLSSRPDLEWAWIACADFPPK